MYSLHCPRFPRRLLSIFSLLSAAVVASQVAAAANAEPGRGLLVTIDPRIELVAVAQHLSGYTKLDPRFEGRINNLEHPYITAMKQDFEAYRGSEALKRFGALRVAGSDPVAIAVQMSAPDAVSLTGEPGRLNASLEKARAYVAALGDFAKEVSFAERFGKTRLLREKIVSDFKGSLDLEGITSRLEAYYGSKAGTYIIALAPLLGRTGFGPSAKAPDGSTVFYAVFPAQRLDEQGRLQFGDSSYLVAYLTHEFGHSFSNPLVDRHWKELSAYASLMGHVKYPKSSNYGRDWRVYLYEAMVRAVTARLVFKVKGQAAYDEQMEKDKRGGFFFQPELCRALESYETERSKYPSLDDFYPELRRVIEQVASPSKVAD